MFDQIHSPFPRPLSNETKHIKQGKTHIIKSLPPFKETNWKKQKMEKQEVSDNYLVQ